MTRKTLRRRTIQRLVQGPATAGQLAALFSVNRPAVSRHLRVLRHTGLVTATSSGKNVWYQTRHAALASLSEWLDFVAKRAADAGLMPSRDGMPRVVPVINVTSLGETARQVVAHGGTIVVEPFTIAGVGRGCYFTDPTGVIVGLHDADTIPAS